MTPDQLRKFRSRKDLTQQELADWLKGGATKRAVIAWENGQNPVPKWVEEKISEDGVRLNPKVDIESLRKAMLKAEEQGVSLDDWVAEIITREANSQQ